MKKLRLEEIINLVDDNSIVADIGTDHGIVPFELIKSNKAKKGETKCLRVERAFAVYSLGVQVALPFLES